MCAYSGSSDLFQSIPKEKKKGKKSQTAVVVSPEKGKKISSLGHEVLVSECISGWLLSFTLTFSVTF